MKPTIKIFCLACCLIGVARAEVYANQTTFTITQTDSIIGDDKIDPSMFNTGAQDFYDEKSDYENRVPLRATDFVHQSRYRAKGEVEFVNRSFLDNFYVGINGGLTGLIHREGIEMETGTQFGVTATKYFLPWSGLRLSLSYAKSRSKLDKLDWHNYGIALDHVFNLSSYIDGFDPFRSWEILTTEGIGLSRSKLGDETGTAFDAHLGLQFKVNTGTRLDIYVEPRISIYSDGIDVSGRQNWRRYDIGYGALLGATYRLGTAYERGERGDGSSFWDRAFIDFSSGTQMMLSSAARQMGYVRAMGNSGSIGIGAWLGEAVAFRLSGFASYNGWQPRTAGGGIDRIAAYAGGRVELMLDPVAIATHDKDRYPLSVQPLAGVELGYALKQDGQINSTSYVGFTAGLRLKHRLSNEVAWFVEPRYSIVPYSYYHTTFYGVNEEYDFADRLLSVNIGLEFYRGRLAEGAARANDEFTPHFTFSAGAGAAFAMQQWRVADRRTSYMGGLGIGYWFNRSSGLRFNGEIGTMVTRQPDELRQVLLTGAVVYTLNLTNAINGYDSARKWGVELFAGPAAGIVNQHGGRRAFHLGAEGGGRLSYLVDETFDIYLEPKYRLFTTRLLPVGDGTPLMGQLSIGTTYHFAHRGRPLGGGEGILGNTFFGMSIGAVNGITGVRALFRGEERNFMNSLGPSVQAYVGKWFQPWFGMRFGASGSFHSHTLGNKVRADQMTAYFAATAEALLNPFRIGERRFVAELIPMAGLQAGVYWHEQGRGNVPRGNYTALTAALQLKLNASETFAFTIEPRATRAIFNSYGHPLNDNMLGMNFGIEMTRPSRETIKNRNKEAEGFIPTFFASVGIGGASQLSPLRYNNLSMGLAAEVAGGWRFTPYSAARIGIDYAKVKPKRQGITAQDVNLTTVALDYTWELSNAFAGYDPKRKAGVEVFVGPALSFSSGEESKAHFGGELGARVYYKLNKHFDIYCQPKGRVYVNSVTPERFGQRSPLMFSMSIGTNYTF